MKKNFLKSILILSISIIFLIMLTATSEANLSISSKSTVSPGENFSVTISVGNDEAGVINLSVSNGTLSQTYIDLMTQSSVTVNCTAGASGTISISGSGKVANYTTDTEGTQSASKSITIVQPEPPANNNGGTSSNGSTSSNGGTTNQNNNNNTKPKENKSSNSRLGSLQIAEGTITPEFENKTREYTINVPNEIKTLNIEAIAAHSKATVRITGNDDLQVGENEISIVVTAEDGSKTTYTITAIRADEELGLQSLSVFYINEDGEKTPLNIEPLFGAGIYEYTLKDISYKIDKLLVEAIANKENATIEIKGNENLKEGKNEIQIIVTIKNEEEEGVEQQEGQENLVEQKIYTIIVNKELAPVPPAPLTTTQKIKNWFNGAGTWISENLMKIQAVALIVSATTLAGLTVYFVYDYKNYKKLLEKLAEINKTNLMEKANFALGTENIKKVENEEGIENVQTTEITEISEEPSKSELLEEFVKTAEMTEEGRTKPGKGKRFR